MSFANQVERKIKGIILKIENAKTREVLSSDRFVEFDLDLHKNTLTAMQNKRLKEQKGKFTKALNGDDIKVNVERFWKKRKYNKKIILAEIVMPDKVRDDCMAFLETKNITHGTLFPDYPGAVEICKIELEIDNPAANRD